MFIFSILFNSTTGGRKKLGILKLATQIASLATQSKLCNDVDIESFNRRVYRETDNSPAYELETRTYTCIRDKDHGGDHKGPMFPDHPEYNAFRFWPPKGYIDERSYV